MPTKCPTLTTRIVSLCTALVRLAFALQVFCSAFAQPTPAGKPLMLVTWFGPGAIALPDGQDWKAEMLTVYDNITRPVAQFSKGAGLTVSFSVFENLSGKPSAEGCREDAINPILKHDARVIYKRVDGEVKTTAGETLATTSYLLALDPAGGHFSHNLFGFAGNAKSCAEIHISSVSGTPAEDRMQAVLTDFHPDLTYQPNAGDYFRLASVLFKNSPGLAASYYKASLDAMPDEASSTARRDRADGSTGDVAGVEWRLQGQSRRRRERDRHRPRLPNQLLQSGLCRRGARGRNRRKDAFEAGL